LGRKNERFIATDGPLEEGTERFWRLVWQEASREIVMLTRPREKGVVKCDVNYPENVGQVLEMELEMNVECLTIVKESGTEVRKLKLVREQEERIIWHFLYLNWPDMTPPQGKDQEILDLIKMTRYRLDNREERKKGSGPRIVHCSPGVGRTGTFIALDHLLQDLGKWREGDLGADDPVFETVKKLRQQRMKLVYNQDQYAYLYQFLVEQWEM
jgi:protein-tyrosine phosphatase